MILVTGNITILLNCFWKRKDSKYFKVNLVIFVWSLAFGAVLRVSTRVKLNQTPNKSNSKQEKSTLTKFYLQKVKIF
jgi:hypothetical protein